MLDKLMRRLPDADNTDLLTDLLEDAGEFIKSYTGRSCVPASLTCVQLHLAIVFYNRMGMEGELEHGEGGIERRAEYIPEDIRRQLNPFRLVKGVGV